MKKLSIILALTLSMAALAGCAQGSAEETDFKQYLPEGAQFVKEKAEDGGIVRSYKGSEGEKFKLFLDASGAVCALEEKFLRTEYSSGVPLSASDAFEKLLTIYPEAKLRSAAVRTDPDGTVWVMIFTSGESLYALELEANSGDVWKSTQFFGDATDADPTEQILVSYPTAEITRLKPDFEDGRVIYDGIAKVESLCFDFQVDFETGQLLEWDLDD